MGKFSASRSHGDDFILEINEPNYVCNLNVLNLVFIRLLIDMGTMDSKKTTDGMKMAYGMDSDDLFKSSIENVLYITSLTSAICDRLAFSNTVSTSDMASYLKTYAADEMLLDRMVKNNQLSLMLADFCDSKESVGAKLRDVDCASALKRFRNTLAMAMFLLDDRNKMIMITKWLEEVKDNQLEIPYDNKWFSSVGDIIFHLWLKLKYKDVYICSESAMVVLTSSNSLYQALQEIDGSKFLIESKIPLTVMLNCFNVKLLNMTLDKGLTNMVVKVSKTTEVFKQIQGAKAKSVYTDMRLNSVFLTVLSTFVVSEEFRNTFKCIYMLIESTLMESGTAKVKEMISQLKDAVSAIEKSGDVYSDVEVEENLAIRNEKVIWGSLDVDRNTFISLVKCCTIDTNLMFKPNSSNTIANSISAGLLYTLTELFMRIRSTLAKNIATEIWSFKTTLHKVTMLGIAESKALKLTELNDDLNEEYKNVLEERKSEKNRLAELEAVVANMEEVKSVEDSYPVDYEDKKLFEELIQRVSDLEAKLSKSESRLMEYRAVLLDTDKLDMVENLEEEDFDVITMEDKIDLIKSKSICLVTGTSISRITEELGVVQRVSDKSKNIGNVLPKDCKYDYIGVYTPVIGHHVVSRVKSTCKHTGANFYMLNSSNFSIIVDVLYSAIMESNNK